MPRGRSKADATDWLRRNRSQAKPSAARITSGAPRVLPLAHFFGEAPERRPWILKHDDAGRSLPGFTFAFSVSLGWIYPQIVAIEPSMLASSARDSGTYCGKDSIKTLWGLATFLSPSHCSGSALSGPPKWPSLSPPPTQQTRLSPVGEDQSSSRAAPATPHYKVGLAPMGQVARTPDISVPTDHNKHCSPK